MYLQSDEKLRCFKSMLLISISQKKWKKTKIHHKLSSKYFLIQSNHRNSPWSKIIFQRKRTAPNYLPLSGQYYILGTSAMDRLLVKSLLLARGQQGMHLTHELLRYVVPCAGHLPHCRYIWTLLRRFTAALPFYTTCHQVFWQKTRTWQIKTCVVIRVTCSSKSAHNHRPEEYDPVMVAAYNYRIVYIMVINI